MIASARLWCDNDAGMPGLACISMHACTALTRLNQEDLEDAVAEGLVRLDVRLPEGQVESLGVVRADGQHVVQRRPQLELAARGQAA